MKLAATATSLVGANSSMSGLLAHGAELTPPHHVKKQTGAEVFLFDGRQKVRSPLDEKRERLDFFFWAATETLKLIVYAALTVYLVVSLATGHDLLPQELMFWK